MDEYKIRDMYKGVRDCQCCRFDLHPRTKDRRYLIALHLDAILLIAEPPETNKANASFWHDGSLVELVGRNVDEERRHA